MSKSLLISEVLAIFLLLIASNVVAETPNKCPPTPSLDSKNITDNNYNTTISKVYSDATGLSEVYIDAEYQGKPIGWLYVKPNSNVNMFTVLNSVYWENKSVYVYISKSNITGVYAVKDAAAETLSKYPPTSSPDSKNITDNNYNTTISKVYSDATGLSEVYIDAEYQGKPIGWLYVKPNSNVNMFTVLNSVYWENKSVYVYVSKGSITGVYAIK